MYVCIIGYVCVCVCVCVWVCVCVCLSLSPHCLPCRRCLAGVAFCSPTSTVPYTSMLCHDNQQESRADSGHVRRVSPVPCLFARYLVLGTRERVRSVCPVMSWARVVFVCPAVLTRGTNRAIVRGLVSCRQILGSPCSRVSARGRRSRRVPQTVSRHVHTECRVFRGFKRLLIGVHPRDKLN